jgi:hypothetical protein
MNEITIAPNTNCDADDEGNCVFLVATPAGLVQAAGPVPNLVSIVLLGHCSNRSHKRITSFWCGCTISNKGCYRHKLK